MICTEILFKLLMSLYLIVQIWYDAFHVGIRCKLIFSFHFMLYNFYFRTLA